MRRKTITRKNLLQQSYWFADTTPTSPDYFQITEFPTQLTAGKNLFKIKAANNVFRNGSMVNIEVVDFNGNPIYHEVLNYLDDDKSRVVAIYVYDDTPVGDCTIIVTGEAVDVPTEWQGVPNVIWSRIVTVNNTIANTSEIIFDVEPVVTIKEQVGAHLNRTYANGQTPTYNTGTVKYYSYNGQPALKLTGGKFNVDMNGGVITVSSPQNPTPTGGLTLPTTAFSSSIKKVLSDTLALLDAEYTVYSTTSFQSYTYTAFSDSAYSLSYEAAPTYTATQNSESFAIIEIDGLQAATGDVARIKTFMNNNGTVGTWELINDIELKDTEVFVANTASLYPDQNIAQFTSQSVINTYWEAHTYQGRTETTAPTLTWSTASLMNAMVITSATDISAKNAVHVAQIKSTYRARFTEENSYKITLDAVATQTGRLSVYMSGSAFDYESTDYFTQNLAVKLGRRVGYIELNASQRVDDYVIEFDADRTGTATMLLVIESGEWQVSNIRTTTNNDAGYTPNYTRIRTLVPTAHKSNNQLSFKTEYYNIAGNRSKQISYVYNKTWTGGNRYIDGDYSMITGSLYVADTLESGIAITGQKNTGYVRSLGYTGFDAGNPGFLIWSGSALPGATSKGSAYSGVGIELYANNSSYFRYSTRDSELDVRTDKFFLGSAGQFISGANGNIEISSSGFHLDAAGNITASNGEFRGNNLADFYQFRVVTIGGSLNNLSTYTYGGQTYYSLNLTGSYDPSLASTGPGMFVRIATALSYPIGSINIHPAGWASGKYLYYGALVVIESANDDCYISSTAYNILPDGNISYDADDFVALGFKTQTVGGNTYYNTLQITSGNRALLAQSAFDWKVQSLTSYDTVQVQFPAGMFGTASYATQALTASYAMNGGGGGGTPGGSDTQIQYNNAGSFGGISKFTWNGSIIKVTSSALFTEMMRFESALMGNNYIRFYSTADGNMAIFGYTDSSQDLRIINQTPTGSLSLYTNYLNRMEISSSGDIGIGIASGLINAKLHINNTGSQNSFLVEDSTTPDSTPFVIDNAGNVGVGKTTANAKLDVNGSVIITGSLRATSITSSLQGTASFSLTSSRAISSSYAVTASYAMNAGGGGGSAFPYTGNAVITGSLLISGSSFEVKAAGVGGGGIDTKYSQLIDTGNTASVDWNSRYLLDSNGALSATWGGRTIFDAGAAASIDYGARFLYSNSAADIALNYTGVDGKISTNYYVRKILSLGRQEDFVKTLGTPAPNWDGECIEGVIDIDAHVFDLVALDTDGIWYRVDQTNAISTKMLGIYLGPIEAIDVVLLEGNIIARTGGSDQVGPYIYNLNYGLPVYIRDGTSTSELDTVEPTSNYIRRLGHCYYNSTTDNTYWIFKFRPSNDWTFI